MTKAELKAYLKDCVPVVSRGKVSLVKETKLDEVEVEEQDWPLPDGAKAFLDQHPEGSDRGGYVPWVEVGAARVYYYEPDGEWA